jgi:hypothetical protein
MGGVFEKTVGKHSRSGSGRLVFWGVFFPINVQYPSPATIHSSELKHSTALWQIKAMPKPPCPEYFKPLFFSQNAITHWPIHFAIITVHLNAGQVINGEEDFQKTYQALHQYLNNKHSWVKALSIKHNQFDTACSCCAVNTDWKSACDIAAQFGQEVVYYVADNTLSISYTDQRRKPLFIGPFLRHYVSG